MLKSFLELLIHLAVVLPLALWLMKDRSRKNYLRLGLFSVLYLINQLALSLPYYVPAFDFIGANWNWDGKILGILTGVISVLLFKNYFSENYFLTLKQERSNVKVTVITAAALTVFSIVLTYFMGRSDWDNETLFFELTMPSTEEELMFRGVLLALLLSTLKPQIRFLGNPSVLITAVLFGFVHAFRLNTDYSLSFEPLFFLMTGLGGYIWGWITWKSRSILLAWLSHNFCNFFGTLVTMI
ncbi:MAG: CPBP family intramembrane metalloprotease [Bacteroidia bacterium]|jgi:hypothetical protein|nr:CPBP family intramembrane metalloprotease [Bacteroidia bacterium]